MRVLFDWQRLRLFTVTGYWVLCYPDINTPCSVQHVFHLCNNVPLLSITQDFVYLKMSFNFQFIHCLQSPNPHLLCSMVPQFLTCPLGYVRAVYAFLNAVLIAITDSLILVLIYPIRFVFPQVREVTPHILHFN